MTLRRDATAERMAMEHARRMERKNRVYHNPELKTAAGRRRLGNPATFGENVAVGPNSTSIHRGFMDSRGHRANILERRYRRVGIAAYDDGEALWVVQVFLSNPRSGSVSTVAATNISHRRGAGAPVRSEAAAPATPRLRPEGNPLLVSFTPRGGMLGEATDAVAGGGGIRTRGSRGPGDLLLLVLALAGLAHAARRRRWLRLQTARSRA